MVLRAEDQTQDRPDARSLSLEPFFQNSLDLLCIADFEGRFRRLNPAWEETLGLSREELQTRPFLDFVHPEDRESTTVEFAKLLDGGLTVAFENRYRCADGSYRWMLWKAAADMDRELVYAAARDVTARRSAEAELRNANDAAERKIEERTKDLRAANRRLHQELRQRQEAEASLRHSMKRYQDVFDHAPIGICMTTRDGRILTANRTLEQILGYDEPGALADLNIARDVFESPDVRQVLISQIDSRGTITEAEVRWKRRDGSSVWIELSSSSIVESPVGVPSYLSFVHDIDQRKLLEGQLLQAQKMEAIGRLAGGVAHDFNNILTAVNGYAQLVEEDARLDPALRPDLREIRHAADRATDLTRQLLAFSRKQILEIRELDVGVVVAEMEGMVRRLIGEDVDLALEVETDLYSKIDRVQLEQVILNLCVNARDAMPGGGCLTIEVEKIDLDEEYCRLHDGFEPGAYARLAVTDSGVGMSPEVRARIFEPFYTTKDVQSGTGLGLSTVHGIVQQFEGRIRVYSEVGKGTAFILYLPTVPQPIGESSSVTAAAQEREESGGETILLVEDEAPVRAVSKRMLTAGGYEVITAASGEEALELARDQARRIHLAVTDVVMPGIAGPELAAALLDERPDLKVLYMSGYTEHASLRNGTIEGVVDFIHKPFSAADLRAKVRFVLDRKEEAK